MKNKFSYIDIANNVNNLRLAGHKLSMEWSGEFGAESVTTGTCSCGKGGGSCLARIRVKPERSEEGVQGAPCESDFSERDKATF